MALETVTIPELNDLSISLTSYFATSNLNGKLGKATISDLVTFIAPYIQGVGASGFVPVSGTVLPGVPANSFTLVGPGNYTQGTGGTVVASAVLNILATNGTTWSLVKGIDTSAFLNKQITIINNIGNEINFDFVNNNIIVGEGSYVVRQDKAWLTSIPVQTVPIVGDGAIYIFFNISTKGLEVYSWMDAVTPSKYLDSNLLFLGTCYVVGKSVSVNGAYKIDGWLYGIVLTKPKQLALMTSTGNDVNFDFTNGNFIIYDGTYAVRLDKTSLTLIPAQTIPILGDGVTYIFYNITSKLIEVYSWNDAITPGKFTDNNLLFVGACLRVGRSASINGAYKIDGVLYGIVQNKYDIIANRALFTNKMFVYTDQAIPIFKDSIFVDVESAKLCRVEIGTRVAGVYYRKEIFNPTYLSASELGNSFDIMIEQTTIRGQTIKKSVTVNKANKSEKAGAVYNHIHFADSLGQGNNGLMSSPIYQLKTRLAALGITANMVGSFNIETPTVANTTGLYRGEARGNWQYLNFVGMSNDPYYIVITPKFTGGGTTQFQNPFLRLATSADYTAHPDWCFRNTGAMVEKDYATDSNKSGNFYIFDFANYLAVQAIPTPNVVTIALGTNDWNESPTNDLNRSAKACLIMVSKMREALPDLKIIVIPANTTSIAKPEWVRFASLAEKVITLIEANFPLDTKIHTLPLYAHESRWQATKVLTDAGVIASDNNFRKFNIDFDVHTIDDPNGESMDGYMNALMPAVVYCI